MTKTKIRRSSALLLAVVMLFSMALNSVLPTYAAEPPEWGLVYESTVFGSFVSGVLDTNGEFYYALGYSAFNAGNVSQAYRFEDADGNAQYFAYLTNAIGNVFYDLTGEYGQTNKYVCGGELKNPALEVILVSYGAGKFLAGPYVTTDGQEFYYMDATGVTNAQGAVGDDNLQGYESGSLTDVTVLWDGSSVTVTPERLYPEGKEPNTPVTGITLDKSTLALAVGGSEQLTATIEPPAATNQNVEWTSSDPLVATVSDTGLVTAIAPGTATIFVDAEDGELYATCAVTVTAATVPVTGVSLNKNTATLTVGGTENLSATVNPSNATNQNVTWSSNNTTAATVSSTGVVTARAAGTATITVTTVDGSKTANCIVNITNPIAIGPDGNGDYYKAVGTPPNVFEVVRDAQGTPNVPATYVYDPDGNPLNGGTVPATKFGSDYYVEAPSTIFHKIDASGTYNPNSGIWGGADGKLGGGDDETTISSGDGNWYCHMSQNIYKVVIRASTSGPVMVGGGEDLDPTTSPVTPVGYSSQLGQYIIGPFYDDDGGQYYYSDPIGGNGRIESDATGPKGDDVIWYVGLDGLLTTVKPLRSLICDLFE